MQPFSLAGLCIVGLASSVSALTFASLAKNNFSTSTAIINLHQQEQLRYQVSTGIQHAIVSPGQCDEYMASTGCGWAWTSTHRCPGQPGYSTSGNATSQLTTPSDSLDYKCCCEVGLWDSEKARRGTEVVLHEKASQCKKEADAHPKFELCDWTQKYACPEQFRSDVHEADADRTNLTLNYTCCCTLGWWRNRLAQSYRSLHEHLDKELQESKKLMFVHIPKTAGTAIEDISGKAGIWYPRKWLSFWHGVHMPDGSMCEKYHVPPQYLEALGEPRQDRDVFKTSNSFCVTRHPYERAVSEYLYQLGVPWGQSMSNQYRTGLRTEQQCTAKGMNHFLQQALKKVKEGRKFLHDCHFVPQSEFVFGQDGTRWCEHVLRFKDLPGAFNELMQQHGSSARLSREHHNNSTGVCDGNLTVSHLFAETRRMLNDVYEDDFTLLNYSMKI